MKKKITLLNLLFITLYTCNAYAQPAGVSRLDINTGAGSSYPLHITQFGNKVFCYGNNGSKGWEPHVTDGISKPTLVHDMYPLSTSSISLSFNHPVAELKGRLYFTADNGFTGYELFVYDGSSAPLLASDIETGPGNSSPDDFVALGDTLYFRANTTTEGYELWKYNPGTNTATRLSDINPGANSSLTGGMIAFNNNLYFAADSGSGDIELYRYSPATGTINLVEDIYPGVLPSLPMQFTIAGTKLYFTADDGNHGRELFVYDGITPPSRITDLAGTGSGIPSVKERIVAPFAGKIYFTGIDANNHYQLYSVDAANNVALAATPNTPDSNSFPTWLTPFDGKLYFCSFNDTSGFEMWSCDNGNNIATVFEMCAGTASGNPQQMLAIGDDLYFRANECLGIGEELFKYSPKSISVTNITFDGNVQLYPNPASNNTTLLLQLRNAEQLRVSVTDMYGREVFTNGLQQYTAATHRIQVPLQGIGAGTYFYSVCNAQGQRYTGGKLVVQ